ncbi:MAG TPA: glycoside hydrolase family 2 TIM barrel-domain containing protein [Candidatus Polarisedimenticolia bacterium]|nr:glycoside hydrolase family 2 TIM barrel-domain containing protein [Candidatus Polarisedimenticolia bacterium]
MSCAIVLLAGRTGLVAADRVDLDRDWRFRTDADSIGQRSNWQNHPPKDTVFINLPHTWNLGRQDGFIGKAWYCKTFAVPLQSPDLHVKLHFGATFYSARVWLNGIELGKHEGGYTAYSFDVTHQLRANNYLAVEVDNRIDATTIPGLAQRGDPDSWYDWWDYGGIVRDVWLTVSGPVEVNRQQIRAQVKDGQATVNDLIFLENHFSERKQLQLSVTAFGPDGKTAAHESLKVDVAAGLVPIAIATTVRSPELWGIDHPNLYRMTIEVGDRQGHLLDQQSDTFGIRTVEIRDRHLLVNGERVRLTGVARHEDSVSEGLAETTGTMRYDYDDMKSLQVALTRPVHYPQNPFILDYADRHGILLIPEIPVWQFSETQMKNPQVIARAKQQLREMIEESGNHPSIFAWSVCNESATGTPGGIAYFRTLRDYIKKLDPSRYVTYADDKLPKLKRAEDSAANDADFLMMNQYFGSWHGPESELSESLDRVGSMFPNKAVIISEFGLAGIFAKNPEDADPMRVDIIRKQMPEMARRDWIAGAILWCYQDYKSRRTLRSGWDGGFVEHGLVDEYRQRKPSYYVWKELNALAAIDVRWDASTSAAPSRFRVTVTPKSVESLPYYPLHNYRIAWQISDESGNLIKRGEQAFADLEKPQVVTGEIQPVDAKLLKLHVTLLRPENTIATEKSAEWKAGEGMDTAGSSTSKETPTH